MSLSRYLKFQAGLGIGLAAGWFAAQMAWIAARLARIDPAVSLAQHTHQGAPGCRRMIPGDRQTVRERAAYFALSSLRNFLADMPEPEAMEFLLKQMSRSKNNREFFVQMREG